jgi:serine/threonine protein kinase
LAKAFADPNCRDYIVYPICIRDENEAAQIVFQNLEIDGYRIGVPGSEQLQVLFAVNLKAVVAAIHAAGLVHMDLHPSNIMWKEEGGAVKIKIIDWDSVQLIGQPHSQAIFDRLVKPGSQATVDWDLLHLNVILDNLWWREEQS